MFLARRVALWLLLAWALCASARAGVELIEVKEEQHLRQAEGIVRDKSGAAFAGATIHLINRQTGDVVADTVSHLDGHFVFRRVKPGNYDLKIEARGLNPMLYHLKIDSHGARQLLIVEMVVAT